jgi:hypothetical protein
VWHNAPTAGWRVHAMATGGTIALFAR